MSFNLLVIGFDLDKLQHYPLSFYTGSVCTTKLEKLNAEISNSLSCFRADIKTVISASQASIRNDKNAKHAKSIFV